MKPVFSLQWSSRHVAPLWHVFLVDNLMVLDMELLGKNKWFSMDVDFDFLLPGPG